MNIIDNHDAQAELSTGALIIVDVREPAEYRENHIPGALNFPSTNYNIDHYSGFKGVKIALVCQSGNRAKNVGEKLKKEGYEMLFLLETQMQGISNNIKTKGWTIDRQFRFALGVLLLLYLTLNSILNYAILIPIILCSGLIITALIDRCYMQMGIAMLPWNKGKKI